MTEAKKIRELFKLGKNGVIAAIGIMVGKKYPVSKIINIVLNESKIIHEIKKHRYYKEKVSLHKEYYVSSSRSRHSLDPDKDTNYYRALVYSYNKVTFLKKCRTQIKKDLTEFIKETYDYE
tara:strand:- start:209 stop:571 length:363 start_codon:yes stop_codon:yes gene_type:complete